MAWSELSEWWVEELAGDFSYETVVTPLLLATLNPVPDRLYLDLGAGEGRIMRIMSDRGMSVVGVDLSEQLAAASGSPMVVSEMPPIPMRDGAVDGVYSVLTLEHIFELSVLLTECARITRVGGVLAVVINHPVWTTPGSTPITDTDGEVLWRPGQYFSKGSTQIRPGEHTVTFHHRTMASLLNSAAGSGWSLEHMIERPHHELEDQAGVPRLLACRWRLLP